jgi:hypothetical protein
VFDVSNVNTFVAMFAWGASSFNQDLSGWAISATANLEYMFEGGANLSEENKCAMHGAFQSNSSWPYDWCEQDCAGIWGGTAELDECGDGGGDNTSCDDCAGVPNGDSWESDCGCVATGNSGDDCDDCAGVPNGDSVLDNCDNCDNDLSNDCDMDCVDGDNSGDDCDDCSGVPNGSSEVDECGECGGPGQQMWYDDEDADGLGDCNDSEYSCDGSGIYNNNPPSLVCGDNCPNTYDPTFSGSDEDGLGDVCDDQPYCATNNEDACGVCQGENSSCSGCTDPYASNFNEEANVDDGSCTYPDNGDYSLSFDGIDDYIEIPEIVAGRYYHLECEVRLGGHVDDTDFYTIISKFPLNQLGVWYDQSNAIDFIKNGHGDLFGDEVLRNVWTDVKLTRNNDEYKLY